MFNTSTDKLEKFQDVGNEYSKEKDKKYFINNRSKQKETQPKTYMM